MCPLTIVLPGPSQDLDASIFWRLDFEKHCSFEFQEKLLKNIGSIPDEHVEEVDEGKFNEGGEYGHEAHDDKDIKGCGISYLHCKRTLVANKLICWQIFIVWYLFVANIYPFKGKLVKSDSWLNPP